MTIILDIVGGVALLGLGFVGAFVVTKYESKAAATIQSDVDTVTSTVQTAVNDVSAATSKTDTTKTN